MASVSVRDQQNRGGAVLDMVQRGEIVIVIRDGEGVAELHPRRRAGLIAAELLHQWRAIPHVDPERLRRDVDDVTDQTL